MNFAFHPFIGILPSVINLKLPQSDCNWLTTNHIKKLSCICTELSFIKRGYEGTIMIWWCSLQKVYVEEDTWEKNTAMPSVGLTSWYCIKCIWWPLTSTTAALRVLYLHATRNGHQRSTVEEGNPAAQEATDSWLLSQWQHTATHTDAYDSLCSKQSNRECWRNLKIIIKTKDKSREIFMPVFCLVDTKKKNHIA